jgi:hypothetical protein
MQRYSSRLEGTVCQKIELRELTEKAVRVGIHEYIK